MSDSQRPRELQPTRLLHPWDFPGKSTGVGCHCLLQSYIIEGHKSSRQKEITFHDMNTLSHPASRSRKRIQPALQGAPLVAHSRPCTTPFKDQHEPDFLHHGLMWSGLGHCTSGIMQQVSLVSVEPSLVQHCVCEFEFHPCCQVSLQFTGSCCCVVFHYMLVSQGSYLFPPHCLWMLVSFQFCAIFGIVPPWTFLCESSGKHVITFLSGTHPVVGLPGYMEVVGPSVTLWFVNFVYPFKELGIGFIDFFPRYCFKNLFHFLPDLYYLFSFY